MAFTKRDRPVKTLAPLGANQSLTKRICFRAPVRCFQHSESEVGDRRIERLSINTVAVINEEPIRMVSAAVQQESEGTPVLISNAKEVETRLDASESTSSVELQ